MLRRMTTEFAVAVRLILAENLNVLRSLIRDVAGLKSRFGQLQRNEKLRGAKELI